jgi:hypothetical protein
MKKLHAVLAAVLCLAGAGGLLTSYAQQDTPVKLGAAKLYRQNYASCHGAAGEGSDACRAMMSGPNLLSAVLRMNAKAFLGEVRHVGETNMCAGHLLDLHPQKWKQFGTIYWNFPSKQHRTEASSARIPKNMNLKETNKLD